MKISWINDAGIRVETSQGLILFNHDESALNESSQKDENTIAIFLDENLKKWFKDKWVRMGPGGKIRGTCGGKKKGEGKPKCLPRSKAYALGKKGRASAARRKRRKDPNPNRRGKAINVATKKK